MCLSQPNTPCVECGGDGYLLNNTCIYEITNWQANNTQLVSFCNDTNLLTCKRYPDGKCVRSRPGVRCLECSGDGAIINGECVCYTSTANPLALCTSLLVNIQGVENENATLSTMKCNSPQDPRLGFFAPPPTSSDFVYGQPNPTGIGIPDQCWTNPAGVIVYGPEPGVLTELATSPFFTCNTYCALDPAVPYGTEGYGSCVTCGGHGYWDSTIYQCICDEGFTAVPIGLNYYNQTVYACTDCWGFRGPNPDGYCSAIYGPDPVDGVFKECMGHGDFQDGQCYCYQNSTAGYWQLASISGEFSYLLANGTSVTSFQEVEGCMQCQVGYEMPECLYTNDDTNAPTYSPTTSVPSTHPTSSPVQICQGCPGRHYLPQQMFLSVYKITNFTGIVNQTLCNNFTSQLQITIESNFLNVTNFQNLPPTYTDPQQTLGALICTEFLQSCVAWTWFELVTNSYMYFFFNQVGVTNQNELSGSGINCYLNPQNILIS